MRREAYSVFHKQQSYLFLSSDSLYLTVLLQKCLLLLSLLIQMRLEASHIAQDDTPTT
jgi:hypothetical protein